MKTQYTIEELGELTGFSIRTIRFYISKGLLSPPAGRGRGGFYNEDHLKRLQEIKRLKDEGLSINTIKDLLDGRYYGKQILSFRPDYLNIRSSWAVFEIGDGIRLEIRRDIEEIHSKKLGELINIIKKIMEEKK